MNEETWTPDQIEAMATCQAVRLEHGFNEEPCKADPRFADAVWVINKLSESRGGVMMIPVAARQRAIQLFEQSNPSAFTEWMRKDELKRTGSRVSAKMVHEVLTRGFLISLDDYAAYVIDDSKPGAAEFRALLLAAYPGLVVK